MRIINEAGIFADLANKIRAKRDSIRASQHDAKENKDSYKQYDLMIDNLKNKGYGNVELNYLQRYMLISKGYDGNPSDDINSNMLYDVAMQNKLDSEKIKYLGTIASSGMAFTKDDFRFMASAGTVDQMKMLVYAKSLNIPFSDIPKTWGNKPGPQNQILNVINNYRTYKDTKSEPKKLDFLVSKGYGNAEFLKRYEDADDQVLADAIVASALGKSSSEIIRALNSLGYKKSEVKKESYSNISEAGIKITNQSDLDKLNPKVASLISKEMDKQGVKLDNTADTLYGKLNIQAPHYTLSQLRNKSIQTLQKELKQYANKNKSGNQPTQADKVNQDAADNNQ